MEGWWFAPEIGAAEVWAFQPCKAATVPINGWKVPINGDVDPSILIRPFFKPPPKPKEAPPAAAAPAGATSMLDDLEDEAQDPKASGATPPWKAGAGAGPALIPAASSTAQPPNAQVCQ